MFIWQGIILTASGGIGTDCMGRYQSDNHLITAMVIPLVMWVDVNLIAIWSQPRSCNTFPIYIVTDCMGRCQSDNHMITATVIPLVIWVDVNLITIWSQPRSCNTFPIYIVISLYCFILISQVRAANVKTNKSSTIYGTDSYVVSLAAK